MISNCTNYDELRGLHISIICYVGKRKIFRAKKEIHWELAGWAMDIHHRRSMDPSKPSGS